MRRQSRNAVDGLTAETDAIISRYRASVHDDDDVAAAAGEFARTVVRLAAPGNAHTCRGWLTVTFNAAEWHHRRGVVLSPEKVFTGHLIERYVSVALSDRPATTKRSQRSILRQVGRRVVPENFEYDDEPRGRVARVKPYTPSEMVALLRWAATLATPTQRAQILALICETAGAGLVGSDRRSVFARGVRSHPSGAVLAEVEGGSHPRQVPVTEPYGSILFDVACQLDPDRLLIGPQLHRNKLRTVGSGDVGVGQIAKLSHRGVPQLETRRLESTWWQSATAATNAAVLHAVTGLGATPIDEVVSWLPTPTLDDQVAVLAASPLFEITLHVDVAGAGQRGGARPRRKTVS